MSTNRAAFAGLDDAPVGRPAIIGDTSGTAGKPKRARFTHANLRANAEAARCMTADQIQFVIMGRKHRRFALRLRGRIS